MAAWPSLAEEQSRALKIFENFPAPRLGYDNIAKKYGDAETVRRELSVVRDNWATLRERLAGQVWSFAKMQEMFKIAGAPYEPEHIGITREDIREMFPIVQLMRWRYNLLDLAKRGGFYDEIVP